jgi:transcriptional regulator with XRE-family HTH domain
MEEMGRRIRDERERCKLSREKLSELIETSPSFIGLVERGECGLKLDTLVRLAEVIQVTADYLLTGTDPSAYSDHLKPLSVTAAQLPAEDIDLLTIIAGNLLDRARNKQA